MLHAGFMHLAGNMLFFLVFGSRVNAAVGNLRMSVLYVVLGSLAAWIFLSMTPPGRPVPMLGASGAIMGLAGAYLLLFPLQKVFMAAWIRWGLIGWFRLILKVFSVRGLLVVGSYIALDILFLNLSDNTGVAHWAHVGGFLSGMGAAFVMLAARQVWTGCDLVSLILGRWAWILFGTPADRQPSKDAGLEVTIRN
jgi:membrane associated rhomboid family serine protease